MLKNLIKQLVAAVEDTYLKSLRDATSNSITLPLHQVLDYLFTCYGRIDPDTLLEEADKVRDMNYNLSDPLVTVIGNVEEPERIAVAALNPYSKTQKVQMGLKTIKNTHDFEQGLRDWYGRPPNEHT